MIKITEEWNCITSNYRSYIFQRKKKSYGFIIFNQTTLNGLKKGICCFPFKQSAKSVLSVKYKIYVIAVLCHGQEYFTS